MNKNKRIIVIGGSAAGPKAAALIYMQPEIALNNTI
jgi:hypothetical protein